MADLEIPITKEDNQRSIELFKKFQWNVMKAEAPPIVAIQAATIFMASLAFESPEPERVFNAIMEHLAATFEDNLEKRDKTPNN